MVTLATMTCDLKHRIELCSMREEVVNGATMELKRHAIIKCWAMIEHQYHMPSFMYHNGYAILENRERPSHVITVRNGLGVDISSAAWAYEERLKSAPRWYKILGFVEQGNWLSLYAHLHEKSDEAANPVQHDIVPQPRKMDL
jgi:hypothetical protein